MIPAPFEYVRAGSVEEAVAALAADPDAKLLAGGHSLLPAMRLRLVRVSTLVDIGRLADLSYVREDGDAIAIGALTRHHDVANSEAAAGRAARSSPYAAAQIGDPAVRHVGTIGGLGRARRSGRGPAGGAAGARRVVRGHRRRRRDPHGRGDDPSSPGCSSTALEPNELLTEIRVPKTRRRMELPEVQPSRAGLGAGRRVGRRLERRRPRRPDEHGAHAVARDRGRGGRGGRRGSRRRGRTRREGTAPGDDAFASAEYRRALSEVLVERALREAMG